MNTKQELFNLYQNLIEQVYIKKDSYVENDLTLFSSGIGKEYNDKLMFVGRAVNGWYTRFDKTNIKDKEIVLTDINKHIAEDDLQWVIDLWGNNEYNEDYETDYNTKKSPFWRLIKRLSDELIEKNEFVINKIVWTNLYKISNFKGGNPSGSLRNIQFDTCREILNLEINIFKPQIIIFLTGLPWTKPFISGLNNIMTNANNKYVEFVGKLDNSLIIVGQHPQGKPEIVHFNEIINEINNQ